MEYGWGDYVVYECSYKPAEVGRVIREQPDTNGVFVCYHTGCTAALTPKDMLRPATAEEISAAPADLGFHRFDDYCPEYRRDICYGYCGERFGKYGR